MRRARWVLLTAAMLIAILLGSIVYQGRSAPVKRKAKLAAPKMDLPSQPQPETPPTSPELTQMMLPHQVTRGGFVSSNACRECHQEQFDSWHGSFHRTMTQVATPETVVAPFDDVRLRARGRECYLTREGDHFFVTMADPDWEAGALANGIDISRANPPIVKRQVVMTTGSHHMQGYWISSNVKNMLRQVPWVYLIEERRWVPREDIFLAPPDAERHFAVWNDNCIVCHAVGGAPGFNLENVTVSTEVAELGIACEACHGPGQPHINFHHQKQIATGIKDPIVNPAKCSPDVSSEICGQCHSYFVPPNMESFAKQGYTYRAGGDLHRSHHLVSYAEAKAQGDEGAMACYWNDGTGRLAGREFSAMIESPCYQNGPLSCISCHSSHNSEPDDQLAAGMRTNQACLQCHTSMSDRIAEHTHHAADSSGSLCYNCHMPHTSFGVMKAMRSHRVQIPRVASNAQNDQPNACNLCHLDQTLAWSAEKLTAWYDQPAVKLTRDEQEVAGSLLWLLKGDAVQRAVAAWHMSWQPALEASGDQWQLPFLAELLTDDYAVVRFVSGKALRRYAGFSDLHYDYVGPPTDRQQVKQQTLELWSALDRQPLPEKASPLLLDPQDGAVLRERLEALLREQDKRAVFLPE